MSVDDLVDASLPPLGDTAATATLGGTGARPRGARAIRRVLRHRAVALVAVMGFVACLGFSGVFDGSGYLVPVAFGVLGATACSVAARRWDLLVTEAFVLNTVALLVVGIVVTQWVPGVASAADFASAVVNGWAELLSSQPPAELTSRLSPVPFVVAWLSTALAQELDRRVGVFGIAILGALVGLVATSLFSTEVRGLARWQGGVLVVLAVLLALLHRRENQVDVGVSMTAQGSPAVSLMTPVAVLALVAALAAVLGPRLPLSSANERFDLRDLQENPWDPLDLPSPLVNLKAELKDDVRDQVVFRVTSDTALTRFTAAVMASYDGVVWQVADPVLGGAAQFPPVDPVLPQADDVEEVGERREFEVAIEVVDLAGPWVPHGGDPVAVEGLDDDQDLRFNLATRTLARPQGFEPGDRYTLTTGLHPNAGAAGIEQARLIAEAGTTEVSLVPGPILNLAAELVAGIDLGGPQVAAIRDFLVLEGFYDVGRDQPPGHSYAQIARFVDDPERIVGYEEYYAATAAVLARIAGVPTRVAVGWVIPADRYDVAGRAEVVHGDATAWIEVLVEDVGWVPVDVTPDRSREPTEQEPGRVRQNVAIPNDPPEPPPPFESETTDEDEQDEEEEEEQDDDESDDDRSLLAALADRPGVVAVAVGLSPFVVFGLIAAAAIGAKALRTRRRRRAETAALQITGAWDELVDRLEEAGQPIPRTATPHEIAQLIDSDDPTIEAEVRDLAALLSRSAFAPRPVGAQDADRAWRHTESVTDHTYARLDRLERWKRRADPRPLLYRSSRQTRRRKRPDEVAA